MVALNFSLLNALLELPKLCKQLFNVMIQAISKTISKCINRSLLKNSTLPLSLDAQKKENLKSSSKILDGNEETSLLQQFLKKKSEENKYKRKLINYLKHHNLVLKTEFDKLEDKLNTIENNLNGKRLVMKSRSLDN